MAQQPSNKKAASKSQNRPIAGNTKRSAPTKAQRRSTSTLLTWGAVGIVVVIVVALVIYKVSGGSATSQGGGNGYEAAPQSIVNQVTQIPESVYNTVGITSPATPVTQPTKTSGQSTLTFTGATGTAKPGIVYLGAEYCPYCAAERWAILATLSRFGTVKGIGLTESSTSDVYPGTPSFTFYKATVTSPFFIFKAVEQYSNIPTANGGYTPLMTPSEEELGLVSKYDTGTYIPGGESGSIPFITFANQFLVQGASYSPSILNGLTRNEIASGLDDPTNPVTQAIISTSNYLTASICHITGGQPGNVCASKGVETAAHAMKI